MENFYFTCLSCGNQLEDTGVVIDSIYGDLVCCEICRRLYSIEMVVNYENKSVAIIQATHFIEDEEFQLIRLAVTRVPLKEYLLKQQDDPWGDYLPPSNEKNINPHFEKDLKSIIDKAVTPSDIIRGLKDE